MALKFYFAGKLLQIISDFYANLFVQFFLPNRFIDKLRKGYPFPMLATEPFAKERKGRDNVNGQHFLLKCYAVKVHFEGRYINTVSASFSVCNALYLQCLLNLYCAT